MLQRCRQRFHDRCGSGIGDGAKHLHQFRKFHGAHLVDTVSRHLAGKASVIEPPAVAGRAQLFLHKPIALTQRMVILLLRAFQQAQTLKLCFDTLNAFILPGSPGFPAAKQEKIPFFRCIVPVFFIQVEQSRTSVLLPIVISYSEGRQVEHTFVPGFIPVYGAFDVQIQNLSDAGAGLAHTVGSLKEK